MKKIRLFCCFLGLLLLGGLCFRAAAENAYTYTVRIYAGAQGSFADGSQLLVYDGLQYGDRINFSLSQVKLKEGSKYYVKGIREAGHDNSEVGPTSFPVTRDIDYVVAYGVLSSAVAYTVNYVDGAGNRLAESETYYGNVGDKPVVAHIYVEGWQPQAYNLTRTLTAQAEDNVFDFVYTRIPQPAVTSAATETQGSEAQQTESSTAETTEAAASSETEETTRAGADAQTLPAGSETEKAQAAVPTERGSDEAVQAALAPPAEIIVLDSISVPEVPAAPEKPVLMPWLLIILLSGALAAGTAVFAVLKKKKQERYDA